MSNCILSTFSHFKNGFLAIFEIAKNLIRQNFSWNWFIWFHEFFGLYFFLIFWPTVKKTHKNATQPKRFRDFLHQGCSEICANQIPISAKIFDLSHCYPNFSAGLHSAKLWKKIFWKFQTDIGTILKVLTHETYATCCCKSITTVFASSEICNIW